MSRARLPVFLVKGSDDVLRGEALTTLLDELVGDADRTLVLDEIDLDQGRLGSALDAAQTPPFLTDFRIVVVRRFGRYSKQDEVAPVVDYLADPQPTTCLVLVWEKTNLATSVEGAEPFTKTPKLPPSLTKAVTAAGGEVLDADPAARNLGGWVAEQFAAAGLDLDGRARDKIVDTIGDDAGAVVGIIERLKGVHPEGGRLRVEDLDGLLGQAGGVPPWELTDSIDEGKVAVAVEKLQRMMGAGDRHALAIMATLQTHYLRMLRLDGANVRGEKDAAQVLGLKGSTFPAKKAMAGARRLGTGGIRQATRLLAQADVDLRGAQAWPDELVMEVLVARLAALSRR
jgi:DNA polymerase-3 subunit delta